MISTSAVAISQRQNQLQTLPKRRRSSSTSLSPAKENSGALVTAFLTQKRKRNKSSSTTSPLTNFSKSEKSTFWGWSPKKAKFKPKIMDERGELTDHPEAVAIRSKWQPIVMIFFYLVLLLVGIRGCEAKFVVM